MSRRRTSGNAHDGTNGRQAIALSRIIIVFIQSMVFRTSHHLSLAPVRSRRTLLPLARIERQAIILRRERNLRALRKEEHISRLSLNLLARLIGDGERALNDDLHLVVRVRVDERGALLQPVEAAGDGLLGVDLVADASVSEEKGEGKVWRGTSRTRRRDRRSRSQLAAA